MRKFTVVLLFEKNDAACEGQSYVAHVMAKTPSSAANKGRVDAYENGIPGDIAQRMFVISIFKGHLQDLSVDI